MDLIFSLWSIPVAKEGRLKTDYRQGPSLQYQQKTILAHHVVKNKRNLSAENRVTTDGKNVGAPDSLK